jgi:hypothetical protein
VFYKGKKYIGKDLNKLWFFTNTILSKKAMGAAHPRLV